MSDEEALLAAIWDRPHDDTPRLAYADFLDERGRPEDRARAGFVRLQCRLALLEPWDDGYAALREREKEVLGQWGDRWRARLPPERRRDPFSRGFPRFDLSKYATAELLRLTPEFLALAPLSRYHYAIEGRDLLDVLAWPGLRFQELFSPRPPRLPDGWVERVAGCEALRNVSELCTIDCKLKPAEMKLLLDAWADRHLPIFSPAGNIGDEGMAVLAAHPTAAKLRELDLRGAGLTAAGVRHMADSPHLAGITRLNLSYSRIGRDGVAELLRWPGLKDVRILHLSQTGLGPQAAELIANSPALSELRELYLGTNRLGEAGCRALARSPHLNKLTRLSLYSVAGADRAEKELRARFGKAIGG